MTRAAPLVSKDLADVPGKELTVITVEYPPGGMDPIHTHRAQAIVYVLQGTIVMQVRGRAPVTLTSGQTFYEGRDDVHVVGRKREQDGAGEVRGVPRQGQGRAHPHPREVARPGGAARRRAALSRTGPRPGHHE